jgi:dUTP pyrophosphatase
MKRMRVYLDKGAYMPERANSTDAGLDLRSRETVIIKPREAYTFNTGVHVGIPSGYAGVLVSKSGLNVNKNLLSTGLIDEGYTGAVCVKLYNHGKTPVAIKTGDKISQLVIVPVEYAEVEQVESTEELYDTETERGENGFGSTGR